MAAPGVFSAGASGDFGVRFAQGVRNFTRDVRLTFFGAAVLAGVNGMAPSPPTQARAEATFIETATGIDDDPRWVTGVHGLKVLIDELQAGVRPQHSQELAHLAGQALYGFQQRPENVDAWAKVLAGDVGGFRRLARGTSLPKGEWEYSAHCPRRRRSRSGVEVALKHLLLLEHEGCARVDAARNTRPTHAALFKDLTPPHFTYFAGHYRGEPYRCLETWIVRS